jgi:hypothetical protein
MKKKFLAQQLEKMKAPMKLLDVSFAGPPLQEAAVR